jgi:hypothetical protein
MKSEHTEDPKDGCPIHCTFSAQWVGIDAALTQQKNDGRG